MLVKNVNGSGRFDPPAGYSSWLHYWEVKTGRKVSFCTTSDCWFMDLVGAHVQKANSDDKAWYIVPLCNSCNHRTDTFEVTETLVPVPSRS